MMSMRARIVPNILIGRALADRATVKVAATRAVFGKTKEYLKLLVDILYPQMLRKLADIPSHIEREVMFLIERLHDMPMSTNTN
jgi:hypothetical protein